MKKPTLLHHGWPVAGVLPLIPEEVLSFVERRGIAADWPGVLELTQRLFPDGQVTIYLEADPDVANEQTLIVEANVSPLNVTQMIAARHQRISGVFHQCPATPVCLFGLRMV